MAYELISEQEYQTLPDDDERCFVEFENVCRRNMTRMIDDNTTPEFDRAVRDQYMAAVAAVAKECHVPNVTYDPEDNKSSPYSKFSLFSLIVQGEVARIRIRQRGERHPYSVLLTESTRTKIGHYIFRIRDIVNNSDMDADRKKRIFERLDQLAKDVSDQRLSFAKTMAMLAAIAAIANVTTIAADGHSAIAHIMQLIGQDKETEDAAQKRLTPPPKALPAPAKKSSKDPIHRQTKPLQQSSLSEIEDDIPF